MKKKLYIKPEIERIVLDNSISLQMESIKKESEQPSNLEPRGDGGKGGGSDPFASPFGDKPFN